MKYKRLDKVKFKFEDKVLEGIVTFASDYKSIEYEVCVGKQPNWIYYDMREDEIIEKVNG